MSKPIPEWTDLKTAVQDGYFEGSVATIRNRLDDHPEWKTLRRGVGHTAKIFLHRSTIKALQELYPPGLSAASLKPMDGDGKVRSKRTVKQTVCQA